MFSKQKKAKGSSVGLVVGSFDILHLGHTNLFKFAKRHVDYLIVGLDNDKTIKLVKGFHRPINNYLDRAKLLAELSTIDRIFLIEKVAHHDSEEALNLYESLVNTIQPTHIFTHKICDRHWHKKKMTAKKYRIKFLIDGSKKITNSGTIIKKLGF